MNSFPDLLDENRNDDKKENPIKTNKCSNFDVMQSAMQQNII